MMNENVRRDSERSDETCCSQDTTSTNISDNYCITKLGGNQIYVEENNSSPSYRAVGFNLQGIDETELNGLALNTNLSKQTNGWLPSMSNGNTLNMAFPINEELNQLNPSVCKQNVDRNDPCSTSCNVQSCWSRPQTNRCNSSYFPRELAPLLEQESSASTDSTSQVSKDTSGYEIAIHHSKTYPQDIGDETAYADKFCVCHQHRYSKPTKGYDELADDLKTIGRHYDSLKAMYRKGKKLFIILAVLDVILILCVVTTVPSVAITSNLGPQSYTGTTSSPPSNKESLINYNICFGCTDLEFDPNFTIETLRGIYRKGDSCCFKSITSVYLSLKQIFQNQIDEKVKELNYSVAYLHKNQMINENGEKQNFSTEYIIRRMLLLNAPKEKTAIHVLSAAGSPVQDKTMSGVFHKLRWNRDGDKTIITGKASVHRNGLNVEVQSEGYYFVYTRLHFNTKPGFRDVTISYNINRQRGSTSTYIHEGKESCMSREASMEHSGVTEMVVHLSRYDVIFISVSSSDIEYLSSDSGAHMFGLFEL